MSTKGDLTIKCIGSVVGELERILRFGEKYQRSINLSVEPYNGAFINGTPTFSFYCCLLISLISWIGVLKLIDNHFDVL